MNTVKKLFVQSMVISTSILLFNGINFMIQHFAGNEIVLLWYQPMTIVLSGILFALPTLLLENMEQWDRKKLLLRIALHCLSLYIVVIGASILFGWYSDIGGYLGASIIFFAVYGFVWLTTLWMEKKDEKKINQALDAIRDSE